VTKKARAIQQPQKKKTPHSVPKIIKKKKPTYSPCNSPDSIFGLKPSWRVGLLNIDGEWGWGKIESRKKLLEVMEKLKYFESMTWGWMIFCLSLACVHMRILLCIAPHRFPWG
jgi:hypothetical protein